LFFGRCNAPIKYDFRGYFRAVLNERAVKQKRFFRVFPLLLQTRLFSQKMANYYDGENRPHNRLVIIAVR